MNQLEKWNSDGMIVLKLTEDLWGERPPDLNFEPRQLRLRRCSSFAPVPGSRNVLATVWRRYHVNLAP